MADLTEDQFAKIALLEKRAKAVDALYAQLEQEETPDTSSGKVYSPHWLRLARDQLRLSVMAARRAIEQTEGL